MTSTFQLIAHADLVVKGVMLILVLASVWTWAVVINRILYFRASRKADKAFERAFWSSENLVSLQQELNQVEKNQSPMSRVFLVAMSEWANAPKAPNLHGHDGLKASFISRLERSMDREIQLQLDHQEKHVGGLANVGSAAPFIGLFGTVWGIMNAFANIAESGNTSLDVVAPGIAEALFATALGLVAAIPASVAYNWCSEQVNRATLRLESFASEFALIMRRQIEQA